MRYDKRIPTVDQLADAYIAKMGYYSNEQRGVAREAFKAGRVEGQRYPHGRRSRIGSWGAAPRRRLKDEEPEGTHNGIPK